MSQRTRESLKNIIVTSTVIGFAILGLRSSINAEAVDGYSVEVIDYGIYETEFMKYKTAPDTYGGKIEQVSTKNLLRRTDQVPAKKGTKFGIRYILDGAEQGKDVKVLVKVVHSATVNDHVMSKSNEWFTTKKIGKISFDGWKLNTASEVILGNWTIQIYHEGIKLAEKSFQVF